MTTLSAPPLGLERQLALSTLTVAVAVTVEGKVALAVAEVGGIVVPAGSCPTIWAGERSTGRKRAYPGSVVGEGRKRIRLKAPISTIEKAITQRAASCSIIGLPWSATRMGAPRAVSLW